MLCSEICSGKKITLSIQLQIIRKNFKCKDLLSLTIDAKNLPKKTIETKLEMIQVIRGQSGGGR